MKTFAVSALIFICLKASCQAPSTPSTSSGTNPSTSSGTTNGLSIDSQTHKFTYSEWVKVDGDKTDELYNRAVAWLSKRNDSVENVFHIVKEKDKISSRGYTWLTIHSSAGANYNQRELTRELFYTVTIELKDGGYRFTMSDFYFHYFAKNIFSSDRDSAMESVSNGKPHDTLTQRYFEQVGATAKHFSASLNTFMQPSVTNNSAAKAAAHDNMNERVAAAGDELIKAGNQYYTGLGMTIGGVLVDVISIATLSQIVPIAATNYSPATYGPSPAQPVLEVAGGLLVIIGTVDMIASYTHIKKAGRILKYGAKSELQFGLSHSGGVGLSLTF